MMANGSSSPVSGVADNGSDNGVDSDRRSGAAPMIRVAAGGLITTLLGSAIADRGSGCRLAVSKPAQPLMNPTMQRLLGILCFMVLLA